MDLFKLSESLITEIQTLRHSLSAGKISIDNYAAQVGGIAQIEKQQNFILKAAIAQERYKVKIPGMKNLKALSNVEDEQVKCPGMKDEGITRSDCIDYSGDEKFIECIGCEIGTETKNLLLGKKE